MKSRRLPVELRVVVLAQRSRHDALEDRDVPEQWVILRSVAGGTDARFDGLANELGERYPVATGSLLGSQPESSGRTTVVLDMCVSRYYGATIA